MQTSLLASSSRASRSAWATLALLLTLIAPCLTGCDNVACVYGPNGCQGDTPGIGADPAAFPETGEWILDGAPVVQEFYPSGTEVNRESPIVLVYSESLAPASLENAFLVEEVGGLGGFGIPLTGHLLGGGRVVALFPIPSQAGVGVRVKYADGASVTDLTGQRVRLPASGILGSFTVSSNVDEPPEVVMTWPLDGATEQSDISEIVVVFDQGMLPGTVNQVSFVVTVDGAPPTFNPPPRQWQDPNASGPLGTDTRVYTWRSVDNSGEPVSLGAGASVDVVLSPAGPPPITDDDTQDPTPLPETTFGYTVSDLLPPVAVSVISAPADAIGVAGLDGSNPLQIQLDFAEAALDGDSVGIYLFGTEPEGEEPAVFALQRSYDLSAGAVGVLLGEEELDIASSTSPVVARFADGDLGIAFLYRRGGGVTPVVLVDVDAAILGIQDMALDTNPPMILRLGALGGSIAAFDSDLRNLVVNGAADEELRSVEVSATIGIVPYSNGLLPPVSAWDERSGGFIAAPVPVGLLQASDLPALISVRAYDRALNPAPVLNVPYMQLGAVGPGAVAPGGDVTVTVFDASTLQPIAGALVLVHEDDAGVVTFLADAPTDTAGQATVATSAVADTIVSVDAAGYDLFTFQGVTTARFHVPLHGSGLSPSAVSVTSNSDLQELSQLTNRASDSRIPAPLWPQVDASSCLWEPFTGTTACTFTPYPVASRRLGGLTYMGLDIPADEISYNAPLFLTVFDYRLPRPALAPGDPDIVHFTIDALLTGETEDRAIDVPSQDLLAGSAIGIDLGSLESPPRVLVEAVAPGLQDNLPVGAGVPFDLGGGVWVLRSAYPGVADGIIDGPGDELGELVELKAIEADLMLTVELVDTDGDRSGARSRLSALTGNLLPPEVPKLSAPALNTGGPSFDLVFGNVIPDSVGQPALYRAVLTDTTARSWRLWRTDPDDASGASVRLHVPDIGLGGGAPLADGPLAAVVSVFSLPAPPGDLSYGGFDPGAFLWSDIGRQHALFSTGAPQALIQP